MNRSIRAGESRLFQHPVRAIERASFEMICEWLSDDTPVKDERHDLFGSIGIACRIADRLERDTTPAIAVVGRFGAGKSTIRELATSEMSERGNAKITIVPIELWPYETPKGAVEGVISKLIEALQAEVGTLALKGLSESYANAMNAAGGFWSAIGRLGVAVVVPTDALRQIDQVAKLVDRRFVLWVEDLERFAGTANHDETIAESEKLQPIRALLLGLERLDSVSVITATTTLHARFDLEKIARYVEEVPDLTEADVGPVLKKFRAGCLTRHKFIDPADPKVRGERDNLDQGMGARMRESLGREAVYGLADAVSVVCNSPRVLKQALRGVMETWDALPGEIDFDDLLSMSILKISNPTVFASVRKHAASLRRRPERGVPLVPLPKQEVFGLDAEIQKSAQGDPIMQSALEALVNSVFSQNVSLKPQGLYHRNHADYWQRFLVVPQLEENERDQVVLRVMLNADDDALIDLLESDRSAAVEDFAELIPTERLLRLLPPVVARRAAELASSWPEREKDPPGLIPLWRMWLRRSESGQLSPAEAFERIKQSFDMALPHNLSLATTIEYFFTLPSDVHNFLGGATSPLGRSARDYFRDTFRRVYAGEPTLLADALTGSSNWVLAWATWGLDRIKDNDLEGLPFENWDPIAETILDAARINPRVMLPQLAGLVVRASQSVRADGVRYRYAFDRKVAERLFHDADRMLEVFRSGGVEPSTEESAVNAVLREFKSPLSDHGGTK